MCWQSGKLDTAVCVQTSMGLKVLVQECLYDQFVSKLRHRWGKLRIGKGLDTNCDLSCTHYGTPPSFDEPDYQVYHTVNTHYTHTHNADRAATLVLAPPFSPLASGSTSRKITKLILAESPQSAEQVPERLSVHSQPGEKISPKEAIEENSSKEFSMEYQRGADPPAREMHASLAAARDDVTAPLIAASTSDTTASPASLNWADSEMAEVDANEGFTVVKTKKRRRTSSPEHAAKQPGRPAEKPSSQQQKRPTGPKSMPPQEIKATRANIAAARARQDTTNHENYIFVELCPDIPDYSYLKAIGMLVGGPGRISQFNRMNGHYVVGLATKDQASRLVEAGLDIDGTHLKVFPFRKRAERIVIANLPGFVEDSAIVEALRNFGTVTSIAPIMIKMGEYTFNDGRREAFILLREGVRLESLPTRMTIKSKGDTLSAFLSFGIKCSKCGKQGHRRANCPALARQGNGSPRQTATPTDARPPPPPPPPPPQQPRRPAPAPATPASPVQPAKTPTEAPAIPSAPHPAEPKDLSQPAPVTLPAPMAAPRPLEPAILPLDIEMSEEERTSTPSTPSKGIPAIIQLREHLEKLPSIAINHSGLLGLDWEDAQKLLASPTNMKKRVPSLLETQNKCSINLRTIENYANSPAGGKDANSATSFDFAIDTLFNGAIKAQRSWADSSKDVNLASEDGFTVVQGKKRRRGSAESPVMAAHSSNARRSGSNRRQRSSTERVPRAQEIKTTRTHIVEARARQASSTEEQCLYVEHCPEFEPYHYLKAIDEMVGGTSDVVQVTKMNGHCLLGLANKALAERLINEGLEVEGMLLKTFPFYRRAAKITIGNLPFFVKDASVIDALLPYGRVTSIVPKQLKAGKYVYTDGRREAFIVPHDGINIESIPARLDIRIKGEAWPMYLTSGIRCSRCRGQGHRRAKCPMLTGQSTGPRRASPPSTTNVPQVTAPELPRQASAASPAPPPPDPAMEVSGVLPAAPAAPHQPAVLGQPPPAPMALSMDKSTPVPAPPAPSREKPSNSPTAHTAPQPAESTPPTPHREESTPDFVTYTPPLPPPLTKEEQEALEFQCEAQLCDLLEKLNWEQALEPLFEDGMEENDVPFAVIWPECREQLLPYVSRRHKPILAEFLGTVAEHARDCHPIIQKGLSEVYHTVNTLCMAGVPHKRGDQGAVHHLQHHHHLQLRLRPLGSAMEISNSGVSNEDFQQWSQQWRFPTVGSAMEISNSGVNNGDFQLCGVNNGSFQQWGQQWRFPTVWGQQWRFPTVWGQQWKFPTVGSAMKISNSGVNNGDFQQWSQQLWFLTVGSTMEVSNSGINYGSFQQWSQQWRFPTVESTMEISNSGVSNGDFQQWGQQWRFPTVWDQQWKFPTVESTIVVSNSGLYPFDGIAVMPFRTTKEALKQVHNQVSPVYGAVAVWGEKLSRVLQVVRQLPHSTVWVNSQELSDPGVFHSRVHSTLWTPLASGGLETTSTADWPSMQGVLRDSKPSWQNLPKVVEPLDPEQEVVHVTTVTPNDLTRYIPQFLQSAELTVCSGSLASYKLFYQGALHPPADQTTVCQPISGENMPFAYLPMASEKDIHSCLDGAKQAQIKEFEEKNENFCSFIERLEQFLILEEASEEKKKAYLLTLIGGKAYETLKNLCSPKLPKEYKYEELIEKLVEYFSPRRSIIVERFMFFGRIQKETESVSEYLVEIKRLASTCGFGEFLKESLRDKLVCGLRNAKIQRRILSEGDVPLARVVEIALSMEAAEKNTRIFHVNEPADSVDKIRSEFRNRYDRVQKRKCIHCGRLHKDLCRFREATCFRCGKRGHLATICRSRGEHTSERQVSRFLNQRKINQIEDQEEEEEESVQRMVFVRTYDYRVKYATNDPPYVIKVRVEDTLMTFEIDTGSCLTLISEKDFKRYLPDVQVKEVGIIVKTYDGTVVPILGEIDVKVDFRGTIAKLRAVVVRGERKALLGREWINVLKIGNYFVNQMPLEDTLAELLSEYQVVFGEITDPIKGFTFAVNIQDVNPIFHKARPVPFAIRTAVNEVLERMVEKDYLYQVPSSKWATPVVVVPKKNKEFRICCDFKVTLNRFLDTAAYPLPTQQDLFSVLARGKYFSKLDLSNAYLQLEGSVRRRSRSVKKELPLREKVLVPYDATLPLSLATDASQIGVGAVLSHVIEGQEKPIMFASRTLSGAERNYSQIEREALAIIYGVTKFHQFIYGRQFTLITDHKPLVSILGPRAGIPTLSTSRLQRWGLTLAAYTYEIKFRRTQDHGNADLLSRLPVESDEKPVLNQTFILSYVEDLPVTAAEIGVETKKDEVLSVVKRYTQQGWPERVGEYLRPYFQRKLELTMDGECLLWGMRVIIPSSLRKNMWSCLHKTHSGMGKMKAVARSHFWWPNLDNQIECMSNDLAERAVQLIKMALEKNKRKFEDTIQDTLSRILLTYRCTPHETTGKTPSELFMGRSLRTRLTLIHQSLDNRVRERQARQMRYDRGRGQEEFEVDDKVWCKNFRGVGWIPGRIVGRKGSRVYTVLINGQVKTYHRDQIRRRWTSGEDGDEAREKREEEDDPIWMAPESMNSRRDRESFSSETAGLPQDPVSGDQGVEIESSPRESACSSDKEARTEERPLPRRNPPRDRRPPVRYQSIVDDDNCVYMDIYSVCVFSEIPRRGVHGPVIRRAGGGDSDLLPRPRAIPVPVLPGGPSSGTGQCGGAGAQLLQPLPCPAALR
ncbi:K02A2.6-like, partial [Cordylochernes scorpioides]